VFGKLSSGQVERNASYAAMEWPAKGVGKSNKGESRLSQRSFKRPRKAGKNCPSPLLPNDAPSMALLVLEKLHGV